MANLDENQLEQALIHLDSLRGTMPDEHIDEMQRRLMSSPDEVAEQTRAEIDEQMEYDLDPVDDVPPAFYFESDRQITLGRGQQQKTITIRYLNPEDLGHLSTQVPDAWQFIAKKGARSLEQAGFETFMAEVLKKAVSEKKKTKSRFYYKFLECLAYCLNTPEQEPVVDIAYLKACGFGQQAQAAKAIWEVNREDFLEVWAVMPGPIHELATILTGKTMKMIKKLENLELNLERISSGFGGTSSGGQTNS